MRLPVEIVRRTREAVGPDFIIIYRLSMLDLIPDGSTWDEAVTLAKAISAAGATIINTGIGWHEARVPTIATSVPRAAFTWVTQKMRAELRADGIDIRWSRPTGSTLRRSPSGSWPRSRRTWSAWPDHCWPMRLRAQGRGWTVRSDQHVHRVQPGLPGPRVQEQDGLVPGQSRAGHERDLVIAPTTVRKRIAVVGAGPAGLAAATTLAERGHAVDLFDSADEIGGQFNLAKRIPGKEEFRETLRYFGHRIEDTGVQLHLTTRIGAEHLIALRFDAVLLASGVTPRSPRITGQDSPRDRLRRRILRADGPWAAGGDRRRRRDRLRRGRVSRGHDAAQTSPALDLAAWQREWGVVDPGTVRGGRGRDPGRLRAARQVTLLQRKAGKLGAGLGKTTGWIHRSALKMKNVELLPGVNYERIGPHDGALGLFVTFGAQRADGTVIACDSIVLCAGQEPQRELQAPLVAAGVAVHLIGGAFEAAELDAKRAIDQGTRVAAAV